MKTRIKLLVTSLLITAFYFSSNAQVNINVGDDIYVCTGDSVVLPRVRVVTPSCIDSSLISCPTYWLNLNLYCGCDQLQYLGDSWDAEIYSGVSSVTPGFCPSQISNWSGGNGGLFTTGLFYNTSFGTSNFVVYHPSPADYSIGYSNLLFSSGGQIDTLKLIYTTGIELGPDRLICAPLSNIQLSALISGGNNVDIWAGWTGGLGVFSPNNIISNPTYTPTSAEISNGLVNLIYTDSKLTGSCKSDTLTIFLNNSITSNVTVDAGNTINTCGSSLPLSITATGSNVNQVTWYGHGIFSSTSTLSTNYSLSNDEIQTGYGSIAVIATDPNNCSITDTLNFNIQTRVDILNDNTNNLYTTDKKEVIICATAGSTYNLSGIVKGISNNVTWTTNGSGSFLNPNSMSPIYTFSSQDIQNNIVTIYFQSNGCNNPKDSLKIKINNITANLNFGNLPFFGSCNTTYSFPVNFSGVTYPWGNNYCLLGYTTTVTLDNNPITPDPNTGLYSIGPLSAGLHQIEVYGACNNLIGTHFIDIPSGIIGIQDTTVCEGQNVLLYGMGGSNYVWSGGVVDGVPFLPPGPGVFTYNLTGIDNCGNVGYDTVTVTVGSSNTFFQIFNSTLCSGSNSDPIQFFSNNNNYITYYWDYGFQSGINVQPSSGYFFIPNGVPYVDSIQYIATNTTNQPQTVTLYGYYENDGCGNMIQQQFVLLPEENVNAGPDLTICQGSSVTLTGSGSGVVNYSWNNNVQNGTSFTPTTSTVYTLTGTHPFGGCTYTDQVTVTVNPNPIVDAGPNQSVCAGTSVTLNGSGANTYSWDNGVINGISFTPTATTIFNVTGTNNTTGCTGTDQVTVTVNPIPIIDAGPNQSICAGTSVTLNGSGANTYSWNNGVTNGISFVPTVTNTYIVTGTNTTTGCIGTDQVTITVNPIPIIDAGPNQSVCTGTSVTLNGSGANTYTWNNGVTNGISFIPTATTIFNVTGTNTTTGCIGTDQVTVTVNPIPIVDAGPNQSICAGTSVTLNGSGANTYSWNNGVTNGISFIPNFTLSYSVTGTNTTTGCIGTDQVTIIVKPLPSVTITSFPLTLSGIVCEGDSYQLVATGNPSGGSYSWNPGNQTTSQITISTNVGQSGTQTNSVIYTFNGCSSPAINQNVQVLPIPIVNVPDYSTCAGDTLIIIPDVSPTGGTYLWSNGSTANQISIIGPVFTDNYQLSYTVNGCTNSDIGEILINPNTYSTINEISIGNYTWPVNGQTYSEDGIYTGIIPNQYGCDSIITLALTISNNSISEVVNSTTISVYPNPNNGSFTVKVPEYLIGHEYHIKSVNGSVVGSGWIKENSSELSVSKSLTSGLYIFTIGSENTRLIIENQE